MNGSELSLDALRIALTGLPISAIRYFKRTGSTNDEAIHWAEAGAPDLALVVADEQTAGRGRLGRRWFTPPGSALAFSLVVREIRLNTDLAKLTALGALAVSAALRQLYGLNPKIKWPNDVLLNERKLCGILAEAVWQGEHLAHVIVGIGINIMPSAVPDEPQLIYPATCVEAVLGRSVSRLELLRAVLVQFLELHLHLPEADLIRIWEGQLAYRGEWVLLTDALGNEREGLVLGLNNDGSLRLSDHNQQIFSVRAGEIHLRANSRSNPQTG
jgi:BirA family transcriptional regulator, biotin operon repressor / biotin---[acetyl-CoA-carboxylase] ligase